MKISYNWLKSYIPEVPLPEKLSDIFIDIATDETMQGGGKEIAIHQLIDVMAQKGIPMPEGRMIRNQQFKYWIYNEGMQRETLYDIKNDPYELVNLANDPKYQTALKDCRAQLMEWAVKNKDPYINNLVK
jgi:hypothetical protein